MDVLGGITKSSNATPSVLIIVAIAVVIIIIAIPLYKTGKEAEKTKRAQYIERDQVAIQRDQILIDVVKNNATAMTKLSTVLEGSNKSCGECKKEQLLHFEKLHKNNTEVLAGINRVETIVDERLERRG